MLQQAVALHQKGQLAEAAILYRKILAENPQNGDALHFLGVLEAQRNNALAGIQLIERALEFQPNNALLFFNRGNVLRYLKRFDDALVSYDRALAINADHADALYYRGAVLRALNRSDEALASYDGAIAVEPNHAEALNGRGTMLHELRRFDDALTSYDHALAIKADYAEALYNRGNALQELDRFDEALASYDRALAIQPDYAQALNNRGNALQDLHRFDDALASYDRALAIRPDYVHALINRGLTLHALKRFEDELATYERALALDPKNAEALNRSGDALRALKRFDEALETFDQALAIAPHLANAAVNREMTLLDMGQLARLPAIAARSLFDDASSRYDETMLVKLGYRGHLHLRALAERVLPRMTPPWRILDLGSGTGLVGMAFKDLAVGGQLDGIDLSPRMIETARARNIYDELILGDIESVLAEPGPAYELILAADTMIYVGNLAPTFSGVVNRLLPGGFYIFACESKQGEGWQLTSAHRFRHSESYVRAEAVRAGLDFIDIMECFIRNESAEPVAGFAAALKKPESVSL